MRKVLLPLVVACVLVAGCADRSGRRSLDPGTSPTTGGLSSDPPMTTGPPPDETQHDDDPAWPGMNLTADLWNDGSTHRIIARGSNDGTQVYKVQSRCGGPWHYTYEDPSGESFSPRPGLSSCQEFALTEFQPGAFRQNTAHWNETRWNAELGEAEHVPPGTYVWTIQFTVYDESGEKRLDLTVPFEVEVRG
jgi:hypothetical protein